MKKVTYILPALLLLASLALADIVHMKDGRKLEGEIITETADAITLKMKHGTVELYKSQIKEVEKKPLSAEVYRRKLTALAPGDAEGHYRLALWCKEQGLDAEYRQALEKVIAANPGHAAARKALGYKRKGSTWVKEKPAPPPAPGVKEAMEIIKAALSAEPDKAAELIKKLRSFDGMKKISFEQCARQIKKWRSFKPAKAGEQKVKFAKSGLTCQVSIPEGCDGKKPVPLILTLHGSDETAADLLRAWSASTAGAKIKKECILIIPQSESSYWWEPGVRAKLDLLIAEVKDTYNVDTDRFYLSGFSNGAHGAWYYGLRRPDLFAAIAPDSGLPVSTAGDKVDYDSLRNALNMAVYVINAKEDRIAPGPRVAQIIRKLKSCGCSQVVHREFPGGRKVHAVQEWGKVYDWFKKQTRNPFPGKVKIYFDGTGPKRNCYLELIDPEPGAKASARVEENRIEVTASGAGRVVVYLSDELLDLDRKVTVRLNNRRVYYGVIKRSAAVALETCLARNDRNFNYAAKLTFDLKQPDTSPERQK